MVFFPGLNIRWALVRFEFRKLPIFNWKTKLVSIFSK